MSAKPCHLCLFFRLDVFLQTGSKHAASCPAVVNRVLCKTMTLAQNRPWWGWETQQCQLQLIWLTAGYQNTCYIKSDEFILKLTGDLEFISFLFAKWMPQIIYGALQINSLSSYLKISVVPNLMFIQFCVWCWISVSTVLKSSTYCFPLFILFNSNHWDHCCSQRL